MMVNMSTAFCYKGPGLGSEQMGSARLGSDSLRHLAWCDWVPGVRQQQPRSLTGYLWPTIIPIPP